MKWLLIILIMSQGIPIQLTVIPTEYTSKQDCELQGSVIINIPGYISNKPLDAWGLRSYSGTGLSYKCILK